ncbi:hypothetical protein [Variovorax ginsengisoli]|uniref:Holin-X, holin superfamily III n=1 Tax=Variovorax ginsengisoli TaxID=363844 RepID=A0ABT9S5F5_9BURK|nr:hypothetical protein [Variovorax ginsengisoli]MDP9899589.1 hypothetical protein [Variovorax ginsengisoli]
MTSFVHVEQPLAHPGVVRAEAFVDHLNAARHNVDGTRGLAALLLAAIVSALLVVADRFVANEGGLLGVWAVMWVVAFIAIAFFSGTARNLAARTVAGVQAYAARRDAARADERFLAYAKLDARIMQDLQAATTRHEATDVAAPVVAKQSALDLVARRSADVQAPTLYEAMRRVNLGKYY